MNATVRTRLSPAARKKQLLDTAKAMIVEEGLQHFTMEALARTAGVTTPLVYNYFSGRQALLKSLLVQEYESYRLKTVAEVRAAKSFDDVVRAYVTSNLIIMRRAASYLYCRVSLKLLRSLSSI